MTVVVISANIPIIPIRWNHLPPMKKQTAKLQAQVYLLYVLYGRL